MNVSTGVPVLVCALAVFGIAGCSGEARPLEEAVEVRQLGLASLEVVRPEGTLLPLYVNPGERLAFAIGGGGVNGQEIEVSGTDRDWRVSDPAVASIDDDGVLTARADGTVLVDVRIADIVASGFEVTISDAALETIEEIDGPDSVDPCLAASYVATGGFNDGSTRALSSVEWSTPGTADTRLETREGSGVLFTGRAPTTVDLTASSGSVSLSVPVVVADTLRSIEIGPDTRAARVGRTQNLTATGTYEDADGDDITETITDGVEWSVDGGDSAFAEVSNEAGTRGQVTAREVGSPTIRASCGEIVAEETFTVIAESSGSDGEGLSFENAPNGVLSIALNGGAVQLRVSSSDTYDRDEDITDSSGTIWTLIDTGQQIARLETVSPNKGVLTPLATGSVDVQVTFNGEVATLTVTIF